MGTRAQKYPKSTPLLKRHENEEKSDIDHVLRNEHTINLVSLMLVSFFSEDNVLSDEFSNIKVTKIKRSAFLGTPGIHVKDGLSYPWYSICLLCPLHVSIQIMALLNNQISTILFKIKLE